MIKLFGLGKRRPDLSPDAFHDYWRHPHGSWGRTMSTLRGYVQSHQIHSDLLGRSQNLYELIAEMWVDNVRDVVGFREEPVLKKYLLNDEKMFLQPGGIFLATEERVIVSESPSIGRNPGDEFWDLQSRPLSVKLLHFVSEHEPPSISAALDGKWSRSLGALRHVYCEPVPEVHGEEPPFMAVHELWWPTVRAFSEGVQGVAKQFSSLLNEFADDSVTLLAQAERLL